jgi:hypothetical protein
MIGIDAGLDLLEGEGGFRSLRLRLLGRLQSERADGRRDRGDGERALQQAAAREALGDQLAHRGVVGRVLRRGVLMLQQAGAEGRFVRAVLAHGS